MKLFVTPTSPYARLTMIVRLELGLADRVELVWTRSRVPDDPMLTFNPSGRIPFLHLDDGTGFEDTDLIVEYLDRLAAGNDAGQRRFARPDFGTVGEAPYWDFRRQEITARSLLDGVSVWGRELVRPATEQSPGIILHEQKRAFRLADVFERLAPEDVLAGPINLVQILLFCSLNMARRIPEFDWRPGRPNLAGWFDRMEETPSVLVAAPPRGV
jgi:glutathione S-transferase